jgi:hypothetical protein
MTSGALAVGRPISRVLSGSGLRFTGEPFFPQAVAVAIIYLDPRVAAGFSQPTRNSKGTSSPPSEIGLRSCLALLPVGVTWPPALLPTPVVSYTTFSPLPVDRESVSKPGFDTCWR